jgi:hypothetical protein
MCAGAPGGELRLLAMKVLELTGDSSKLAVACQQRESLSGGATWLRQAGGANVC